jgi:predicted dehydrogenase
MTIRVAVIGVGSMGRNHARVYNELSDANLVAIADINERLGTDVAEKYGVKAYTDYKKLLKHEKPDAISIVVPTAYHLEVALRSLEAGANILIEKPIAATIKEGLSIIHKAEEVDRHLMIGHIVRFNPAIQALKEKIVNGEIGRIFQVFCRRIGPFPKRIRDVGAVVDLATHDLDTMRFLLGESPIRIYAETEQNIHTEYEDMLFSLMRFPGGITGALEINWLTPTKVREVLVLGERGLFRVDDLMQDFYYYENADIENDSWASLVNLKGVSEGRMIRFPLQRYEPLKAELQSFIETVRGDTPCMITGTDGLEALRLALALVESGNKNQVIIV